MSCNVIQEGIARFLAAWLRKGFRQGGSPPELLEEGDSPDVPLICGAPHGTMARLGPINDGDFTRAVRSNHG